MSIRAAAAAATEAEQAAQRAEHEQTKLLNAQAAVRLVRDHLRLDGVAVMTVVQTDRRVYGNGSVVQVDDEDGSICIKVQVTAFATRDSMVQFRMSSQTGDRIAHPRTGAMFPGNPVTTLPALGAQLMLYDKWRADQDEWADTAE